MAYAEVQFLSTAITRFTTIRTYFPTDAMRGTKFETPFKTLYFLPGFSNDATTLASYLGFRRECELKGIAVIIVDGDNSFYVDHPKRLANYSSFIKEVVSFTRMMFPLSDKREDTFLGGISMGGYGALYNGLKYRAIFSKIVALSPSADCYDLICGHPLTTNCSRTHSEARQSTTIAVTICASFTARCRRKKFRISLLPAASRTIWSERALRICVRR